MSCDYQQLPHLGIRTLHPYVPGKTIEQLKKEKAISNIIKLASNENPYGCSPEVLKALSSLSKENISSYPNPAIHPLRKKLASLVNLQEEQLIFCNGSDLLFSLLLMIFGLHRNKTMLTHEKSFSTYEIQAKAYGIPVKHTPILSDWTVNISAMIEACDKDIALIFLANPNNPTGSIISLELLDHLLSSISEEIIVVIDEAYYEYAYELGSPAGLSLLQKYPNVVISRTFSKAYGLAGLRLGYAMANPKIIELIQKVQPPFSVNQLALIAAEAALKDKDFLYKSILMNNKGRKQLEKGFDELNIERLPTSHCNFISFDCKTDSFNIYQALEDQGIIVRPLHAYNLPNYLRVTIGTPEQNTRFLDTLRQILKNN